MADTFVENFLPHSFYGVSVIMPWVSLGMTFFALANIFVYNFALKKETVRLLPYLGISAMINIILNLILIPRYGIIGAVIASCASYFSYLILIWIASNKIIKLMFPWIAILKALISSILISIFLIFVKKFFSPINLPVFLISISMAIILYYLTLFILREDTIIIFIKILLKRNYLK
jgi:O-antigen/teichoic acid export membrane protein